MEPATDPMMRTPISLAILLGGCLLGGGLLGGCLMSEPDPVPLELSSDPDEPIPAPRFATAQQAQASLDALNARAREAVAEAEAHRDCPNAERSELDVMLHAGPTFDRVAEVVEYAAWIQLREPPVPISGTRYYYVAEGMGYCSLGWGTTGCYLDDRHVHCGNGHDPAALASLIEVHGLAARPDMLGEADWVRLIALFADGYPVSDLPQLHDCMSFDPQRVAPPAGSIERSARDVSISMPILRGPWDETNEPTIVEVEIHEGRVEVTYRYSPSSGISPPVATAVAGDEG